jgi:hypothetical protein
MEKYELILRIIEIILQLVLVVFAGLALFAWKREIRGRDKYKLARELLEYIKELRFLIFSKDGVFHQIYLNDIFVDRKKFYENQIFLIKNEKAYFDNSIWGLFNHINTRGDVLLPKQIKPILESLCPMHGKKVGTKEDQITYIQLQGIPKVDNKEIEGENLIIYELNGTKNQTIEEYFKKWEKLINELKRIG